MCRCFVFLIGFVLLTSTALAQEKPTAKAGKAAKKKAAPDPAFAKVVDQPGLPRVLLIGDSISIGYTVPVQEQLKKRANVHRIPVNGGPTTNGLANLKSWLGDAKWDVIHFNWGLHDLKYIGADNTSLADPTAAGSRQQVSLADYEQNLTKLVGQLQATGAKLIWCNTTPVPSGSQGRVAGDEVKYNEVAARVMNKAGIAINDLCGHAAAKLQTIQRPANVHFTDEGSRYLAEHVVAAIDAQLPKP